MLADFICIRELTGGMYFGEKYQDNDKAYDTNYYTRPDPNFLRIASNPCSGRTLAVGSLSNFGSPTAENKTASGLREVWSQSKLRICNLWRECH